MPCSSSTLASLSPSPRLTPPINSPPPSSIRTASCQQAVLAVLSWHLRRIEMAAGAPLDQLPASAAAAAAGSAAPGTLAILSRRTGASAGGPDGRKGEGGDSVKGVSSSLLPLVVAPGELLLGLAAGLDVRFGCRVNSVTYGKKGVTVSTLSGKGGMGGAGCSRWRQRCLLTARLSARPSFIEAKVVGCTPLCSTPLYLI